MNKIEDDHQRVCHQRILQVLDYLKALNDHRNPAVRRVQEQSWFMWLDDLPDHPSIELQSPSATTSAWRPDPATMNISREKEQPALEQVAVGAKTA